MLNIDNKNFSQTGSTVGLAPANMLLKRVFDLLFSVCGLLVLFPLIVGAIIVASVSCRAPGIFRQTRVGMNGKPFIIYKIRSMVDDAQLCSTVTIENDPRITHTGHYLRKYKIDELPQLWNVVRGDMSFVGPRPDVLGFADSLSGQHRSILTVRPGITGPATLKYRDEEQLLASVPDPEKYNSTIIFPDKVRINERYIKTWSMFKDLKYILATIFKAKVDIT